MTDEELNETSENSSEETSEVGSENGSEETSEETSELGSENGSEETSEDTSEPVLNTETLEVINERLESVQGLMFVGVSFIIFFNL